jgi:CheY-like chemotaxis protein
MRVVVFDDVLFGRQQDYAGMGVDFCFYEHADDAVGVVAAELPDIVLMDYAMEDHLTGEEAIQALRLRWPRGQLLIVGISSDVHSNERMVAAGADDAVPKSHLRGYLRGVLRRRNDAAKREAG